MVIHSSSGTNRLTIKQDSTEVYLSRFVGHFKPPLAAVNLSRRALLAATFPEIEKNSLLGADPPEDPLARLESRQCPPRRALDRRGVVVVRRSRESFYYPPNLQYFVAGCSRQTSRVPSFVRRTRRYA